MEIAFCVADLFQDGFLLRGGLTVGPLLHTKKHVVEPAMVEAYRLESKVAIYPRILIDEKVVAVANTARSEDHDEDHEEALVRDFMTADDDRMHYFEYGLGVPSSRSRVARTTTPRRTCNRWVNSRIGLAHPSPDVEAKYLWVHRQYVAASNSSITCPLSMLIDWKILIFAKTSKACPSSQPKPGRPSSPRKRTRQRFSGDVKRPRGGVVAHSRRPPKGVSGLPLRLQTCTEPTARTSMRNTGRPVYD